MRALFASLAVAIPAALWMAPAEAALIACPASFTADGTAKVFYNGNSAADLCQYDDATDQNDVANETNINASGFFGTDTWEINPGQGQLEGAGNEGQSGTWSIANVDFATYDYIIVFKDGEDTSLIAFLFNEEASSGGWDTPFADPPFDVNNPKDVSHLTIARRLTDEPNGVPEPGTLGLLGLGVLGLGLLRRKLAA